MTEERKRRLAAVWFADIVGYTELSSRDEDGALAVVDELQRLAREEVESRGGRIVKFVGDAVLTVFDSTDAALQSALALQQSFSASEIVQRKACGLRIGVHLGEVVEAEDGDVYGDGVNLASRIEGVASAGQVAVSEDVYRQVRGRTEFASRKMGEHSLKGVEGSVPVYLIRRQGALTASDPWMTDPITRLNAALERRYRIERELGEGGMATVYLAKDLKHNRNVALKVLKPELAAVVGAERFLAEIETTANLQHPHILPLFDSGEADGFLFYVMPHVEGESLREKLDREHQLSVDEAVSLTTDIAEALGAAHERGVVHRDIKPANILLSRGRPLVADFGIALAVNAAGGGRLTETGLSLGTPHYMSPEQAAGESHIDARSDIYSLAAMLYEMLAGEPPYTGRTAQVILTKRLTQPVPSVRSIRDKVPASIDASLQQALSPVPADRFATMHAFTSALTTLVVGDPAGPARWKPWAAAGVAAAIVSVVGITVALGRFGGMDPTGVDGTAALNGPASGTAIAELGSNSIAVLPFLDVSADNDEEFMADGVAEELLNLLAQIPELTVISRTTAFSFKGRDELSAPEIAAQLGVAQVLLVSVRKDGNTIRITAQLIDGQSGANLYSETFDRALDDIFALQDEIAGKVATAVLNPNKRLTQYAESDRSSIVVLPFEDMSADNDQAYMADGIAEEVIHLLTNIPELTVIALFKGRDDLSVPEIAAQLGVAQVLMGSVRKAGNELRITAQLLDGQSGASLFSEVFRRPADDVFAVQDEVAAQVVSRLRVTILGEH